MRMLANTPILDLILEIFLTVANNDIAPSAYKNNSLKVTNASLEYLGDIARVTHEVRIATAIPTVLFLLMLLTCSYY